ncbi:hypothetical protein [Neobacillus sp. Marseille-QA0830]
MKNNIFIAVCITITISLLFAWSERWSEGPKQTQKDNNTDIIIYHKKDNWANQSWVVIYGVDGSQSYYGTEKPATTDKEPALIEKARETLTYTWFGLTLLFLFLSVFGLLNKLIPMERKKAAKQPDRPIKTSIGYHN